MGSVLFYFFMQSGSLGFGEGAYRDIDRQQHHFCQVQLHRTASGGAQVHSHQLDLVCCYWRIHLSLFLWIVSSISSDPSPYTYTFPLSFSFSLSANEEEMV